MIQTLLFTVSILFLNMPVAQAGTNEATGQSVQQQVAKTIDIQQKTQSRLKGWAEKEEKLYSDLAALKKKNQYFEKQLKRMEPLLLLEKKKNEELLRRKEETRRVKDELLTYLESVLGMLKAHTKSDLPFLVEERQARIKTLEALLIDPSEFPAEKFRRVFEALQIEAEYGSSVEVVQQNIEIDNTSLLVDVFRLGRLALFFLSIDREKAGYFDRVSKSWKQLPSEINTDLEKAVAMARMERSVELVKLPLGRIVVP